MPILTYFQGRLKDYQRRPRTALLPQKDLHPIATEDHHLPTGSIFDRNPVLYILWYDLSFFCGCEIGYGNDAKRVFTELLKDKGYAPAEMRPVCARYIWFGEGGVQFGVELRYSSKSSRKSAWRQFLMLHSGGSPTDGPERVRLYVFDAKNGVVK